MAKLGPTKIYGDLGVSDSISSKNVYIDRLGSDDSIGLLVGSIANEKFIHLLTTGVTINLRSSTAQAVAAFTNYSGENHYSIFGAGLNDGHYGHIKIGTSGATIGSRHGLIQYDDGDQTSGILRIKNRSATPKIELIAGANTGITITDDEVIVNAAGTMIFGTSTDAISIAQDGTIALKTDAVADANISVSGTIGVGMATGSTAAGTRVYFGSTANYVQFDGAADGGAGALQINKKLNPLKADLSATETYIGEDGYEGPQIGWTPFWFDDFNNDTISEYTITGSYAATYPNINTGTGNLQILQNTTPPGIPGTYTGNGLYFPLKNPSTTLLANKMRYFTMRYRDKTAPGSISYTGGYLAWKKSTDAGWSAANRHNFTIQSGGSKAWYYMWLDMADDGENWTGTTSSVYISDLMIHLNDPVNAAGGNSAQISIDYWGLGHRGFEQRFSSSNMYHWGDVEVEGDLIVDGSAKFDVISATSIITTGSSIVTTKVTTDTLTATTISASTVAYPNGKLQCEYLNAGGSLWSTYTANKPPVMSFGAGYQYGYMYATITPSGSTPIATGFGETIWHVPHNWKTGTSISFDYGFGISSSSVPLGYLDIYWSASTHSFNKDEDEDNYLGREYSTSRFKSWSILATTVYTQTFRTIENIELSSDGMMSGSPIYTGDQISMRWYHKQTAIESATTATMARMMYIRMKYLVND